MDLIRHGLEFVMDIIETIVFVGSLFIVLYLFILQPSIVRGPSMEPTFYTNDYIFVSKITYRFRPMQRGDVVVVNSPRNQDIELIKRVVGLPGDKLLFREGDVYLNGTLLDEPYLNADTPVWQGGYAKEDTAVIVPEDSVFIMGDNRPSSSDSREFGPVPLSNIVGQVFFRYYPPRKIGGIKNPLPADIRSILPYSRLAFSSLFPYN